MPVVFDVRLGSILAMLKGVQMMPMREVCMMRGALMIACLVMLGCFLVMTGCVLVVLRGLLMMFCGAR